MIPLGAVWAIEPMAASHLDAAFRSVGPIEAARFAAVERDPVMNVVDGVAVIDVMGPMTKRGGLFAWLFGAASTQEVAQAIDQAAKDKDVKSILMRVDSPGGSVDGLSELGDAVYRARQSKRVVAQVDGMAASAAYYVASQADKIYANRMDMVGSIGVRLMLYDYSRLFENEGVEAVPIDTGEFKSAGALGTQITESQRADFQRVVDGYFEDFLAVVARGRSMSAKRVRELADGRMFLASEAVSNGLIDGIQGVGDTVSKLARTKSGDAARARARLRNLAVGA